MWLPGLLCIVGPRLTETGVAASPILFPGMAGIRTRLDVAICVCFAAFRVCVLGGVRVFPNSCFKATAVVACLRASPDNFMRALAIGSRSRRPLGDSDAQEQAHACAAGPGSPLPVCARARETPGPAPQFPCAVPRLSAHARV